jgi:D-glycero-D-manno-heptose 1,7-bisphosphate phosphatase
LTPQPDAPLAHNATKALRRAVFLDRDGVINVKLPEDMYVRNVSEFEFIAGAIEALSILSALGFCLVVVTNQRGIARGLMSQDDLVRVHQFMIEEMGKSHVQLDGVYCCPHDGSQNCACRKPRPGMLLSAIRDLGIDPALSYMVGDSEKDVIAGKRAAVRSVRIGSEGDPDADLVFLSLLDFALYLRDREESRGISNGSSGTIRSAL